MKKTVLFIINSFYFVSIVLAWGQTGHRVVGEVAQHHLNKKALKKVENILGGESLAMASTWMDEIRSDPKYNYTHDWHWVAIPDATPYSKTKKNPKGDVISEINSIIKELKTHQLSAEKEKTDLKFLIHLVGDIHQPLHVGNGKDKGGNDIKVKWFWKNANLHRIWDSGMIDEKKLSYTELAKAIDNYGNKQIYLWQNSTLIDWANESVSLRKKVYDFGNSKNLNYKYLYHHWSLVCLRLEQAGIRLAGILNDIYNH